MPKVIIDGVEYFPPDARAVVEGWQPIATAPRDGSSIIVHKNDWPGCPGGVAEECWSGNTDVAAWWDGENGGKGAWICYMAAIRDPDLHFEPTHWMPMPKPPSHFPTTGDQHG